VFRHGKRLGDEGKMDTGLDMIERNVGIISDLVEDLLNFAKQRTPDYEEIDPRVLIEEVLGDIGAREPDRIELRADVAEGAGTVMLDVHAFRQCMGNLVHNALEAIPPDRTGTVRVGYEAEGDRAVFTVSDDGVGMSAETIEKVRGGMYSTKGSKGTGLGLLVIQKIVTEHRGILTIRSEEGKGSTFLIEIPAGGVAPPRAPTDDHGSGSRTADKVTEAV
jgi:signal transduction histidine kinase